MQLVPLQSFHLEVGTWFNLLVVFFSESYQQQLSCAQIRSVAVGTFVRILMLNSTHP